MLMVAVVAHIQDGSQWSLPLVIHLLIYCTPRINAAHLSQQEDIVEIMDYDFRGEVMASATL